MSGFLETWDKHLFGHLLQRLFRVLFMISDELGFRHLDRAGGELLFNLLSQRYKRCCTRVTNNLSFTEWVQAFGEEKLTTLMDWLAHYAHILPTKGVSYRNFINGREKLKKFPGFVNVLDHNHMLSGGQRQAVAISRARYIFSYRQAGNYAQGI